MSDFTSWDQEGTTNLSHTHAHTDTHTNTHIHTHTHTHTHTLTKTFFIKMFSHRKKDV